MSSIALPYVIGNWKMNLDFEAAMALAQACAEMANAVLDHADVGVAVPYPWIPAIATEFYESNLLVGAQDVSAHAEGAFTGEVSAAMLTPWCAFTLIGHSERRRLHGETDELVRDKMEASLAGGLAPVLCVGETQDQRDTGDALAVVTAQVMGAVGRLHGSRLQRIAIAYEPVWAIGTGQTAQPNDAQAMAAHIRSLLAGIDAEAASEVPILYGGSVTADNASLFFAEEDIGGALVGGASLKAESFFPIVRAAFESGE